jgi:hypothetical protein
MENRNINTLVEQLLTINLLYFDGLDDQRQEKVKQFLKKQLKGVVYYYSWIKTLPPSKQGNNSHSTEPYAATGVVQQRKTVTHAQ